MAKKLVAPCRHDTTSKVYAFITFVHHERSAYNLRNFLNNFVNTPPPCIYYILL